MDAELDPQIEIPRDAGNEPCEVCMRQDENWREGG